ncbi:LOW QUALITY PROTEIN: leucine-rich repeat and IQ domain-containing protein 4 [Ciconia maguari]
MTSSRHSYGGREKGVSQQATANHLARGLESRLDYLEELHMERNLIVSIPRDISRLRHKALYLDQNHIQDICEEPGELKCLLSLDLSNNPLSCSLLPVISKLQSLRQLRLYKNLHEIPVQICEYLHHVELLGLSDSLKCLPKEIVNLTKEIYLQKNRFENFPKELCHIANLEIIDLEQNLFSLIPEEVGFLTNLVKLFLAFNNLSSIPPTLQHCQKLAVQDLSHNLLHKLPPALKNLTEMRVLRLLLRAWRSSHTRSAAGCPFRVFIRGTLDCAQYPGPSPD